MKPYYQDDYVTLYNADCRDVLSELEPSELLVTDPPYGMNFQSNYRIRKHNKMAGDKSLPVDLINTAINHVTRAAYVMCRWDNLYEMPKPRSVLAWVKDNWSMGDLQHEHGRQWEACCFYPKAGHRFSKRIPDVIFAPRTGNSLHPSQKPVSLFTQILAANVGETVIDPFAGSGGVGRAAKDLQRKAVLVETSEQYCEISARRMRQEVLPFYKGTV